MMRHVVAALTGAAMSLVVVQGSLAADLPRKAPPMAPPPMVSWTQCYIGGNVGAGWTNKDWSSNYSVEAAALDSYSYNYGSHSATGFVGGLQAGCDYQMGAWVWGIQGMFNWADIGGSHSYDYGYGQLSSNVNWFGTVTGRVGYLVQPMTLVYFKGGAAWVQDKFSSSYDGGYYNYSTTVTRTGWTVGGGVEYKINPSWSVFAEYNYMDFGSASHTLNGYYGSDRWTISQDVQTVLFGVNWRWGGGAMGSAW